MNHIATGRALSLGGDYSHMVMVNTLDGEVDEEVQPGVEAATRSSPRRRRPLGAAAAALGDKDGVEEVLLPQTAAWEEENSWSWVPLTT